MEGEHKRREPSALRCIRPTFGGFAARALISADARLNVFDRFEGRVADAPYFATYGRWPWPWQIAPSATWTTDRRNTRIVERICVPSMAHRAKMADAEMSSPSRPPMGLTPSSLSTTPRRAIEYYDVRGNGDRSDSAPSGVGLMHGLCSAMRRAQTVVEFRAVGVTARPPALGGTCVRITVEVDDADALVGRALARGARVLMPLQDMFWGARYGKVLDPFGHEWTIAQMLRHLNDDEVHLAAVAAY
jgi:uncharacterized glyoxalase superfamily protein PhnB